VQADLPVVLDHANLSYAWGRAFLATAKRGAKEIAPLIVSIAARNDEPDEDLELRALLDESLRVENKLSTETTASTIFPKSLWNVGGSRDDLYARYHRLLPRLKKVDRRNQHGLYFERLIAFGSEERADELEVPDHRTVNQLEHIITTYKRGNRRHTALQAAILDPYVDHTHQRRRGFPCLQQVAFAAFPDGKLIINGFYAAQYVFDRGYGNYLGLYNLGLFMAHEMGLRLTCVNCVVNVATLGDVRKQDMGGLIAAVEERFTHSA
jgi:hypothetical protein